MARASTHLEHDGVHRVGLVGVLHCCLAAAQDALEHINQLAAHAGVLRRREVLQHAQALDLRRGGGAGE